MIYAFIWILGSLAGNSFADVTTMAILLKCSPTFYGIAKGIVYPRKMNVPAPYKWLNVYFAILFTWALVVICSLILLSVGFYRRWANAKNSKTIN